MAPSFMARSRKPTGHDFLVQAVGICALVAAGVLYGMYLGWGAATGVSFFHQTGGVARGETALTSPLPRATSKSYAEVIAFIAADGTDGQAYGNGYDCVDFTLSVWRHAYWQGIAAYPIIIKFEAPPDHMIIGFETADRGWIFIEPQTDKEVFPYLWARYDGRPIVGIYLADFAAWPFAGYPPY